MGDRHFDRPTKVLTFEFCTDQSQSPILYSIVRANRQGLWSQTFRSDWQPFLFIIFDLIDLLFLATISNSNVLIVEKSITYVWVTVYNNFIQQDRTISAIVIGLNSAFICRSDRTIQVSTLIDYIRCDMFRRYQQKNPLSWHTPIWVTTSASCAVTYHS